MCKIMILNKKRPSKNTKNCGFARTIFALRKAAVPPSFRVVPTLEY